VSIKMAKEQNLSLNSAKISGACGRLMCCLRYEYETYLQEIKITPPIDSTVKTDDGIGTVVEANPLRGILKVSINDNVKQYHRDNVKVISAGKGKKPTHNQNDSSNGDEVNN
jgi:cell fate regulator YaaT (PSP1 superfamily)